MLLQPSEPLRSLILALLYLLTCLALLLFTQTLARIQRRLPHSHDNAVDQGPRGLRENTLVAPLDEKIGKNGSMGRPGSQKQQPVLVIQQQGEAHPIAPGEVFDPNNNNSAGSPMTDQGLDR